MTFTFDERGEAAIINLRRDKRFNEALYRELGPVKYWTQVRLAEEAIKQRGQKIDSGMIVLPEQTPQGHTAYTQPPKKEYEDEMVKLGEGNGLPLEKASQKERSKIVNICTSIVLVGAALAVTGICLTVAAMICYGAWTFIF